MKIPLKSARSPGKVYPHVGGHDVAIRMGNSRRQHRETRQLSAYARVLTLFSRQAFLAIQPGVRYEDPHTAAVLAGCTRDAGFQPPASSKVCLFLVVCFAHMI